MALMKIDDIKIGDRRRKDLGDVPALAESIKAVGLLHPVVVTPDNWLVAGERRIAAHVLLQREHVEATVARNLDEAILLERAEREENTCRKDFTPEEAVTRGSIYEPFERHAAAARMESTLKQNIDRSEKITERSKGNALDKVAASVGMSRPTYVKAKEVIEAKQENPDLFAPIVDEMNRTGNVSRAFNQVRSIRNRQSVATPPPMPEGKYSCITIDPPWPVQKIERDERPNQSLHLDYPVMTLEEIAALPVPELAHDDGCHLYLWVTQKYLPNGLALLEQWGFRYQCVMTWVKPGGMTPYSWMYNTEHVLFARKGNLQLTRLGLKLSFDAPVIGHSIKPDVFYERVIEASPGPRLDMFARRTREGFSAWGNEIPEVSRAA